ncbi:kinase domain protein (macronuclear) [Tetrahymena thermophila SB210]|uniref:Kinase domain protein n=1 Tax=Tetrahymena thermophila (strain SB210) TaxID=312017 RepID=W7XBE8_TETTS|nr:kinase domain protein [Tetrahymena thermophila SB210]EWS74662.1 kinase domain protein [Tetrahymena thermophila SB210]|eukprot:XP_012652805.1 kinase domain protein [Tetrahymena thermophila SB210]
MQSFDFTKTTNQQKLEIQFGNIFSSFQINRQSQIYRIVKQCLEFNPQNRTPAVDLLIQFIVQNQNYLDVEISSILNKKQAEQLFQIQKSVAEKSKKQEVELLQITKIYKDQKFEMLIQEFNQLKEKPFEIFEYQIILYLLLKNTQFDSNFEFISVGATGLILGVYNISQKRHSALKIQRVSSKHEIVREIGIIRDCQMPLVIKFYGFFYLDVTKKEDFVVYEIEKCSGNLKQYFNRLKKDKIQLNEEEKMQIAIQVIDVINYLHYNDIVHRDIKIENILYIDSNKSKVPIIKLTDFDQARKMYYNLINDNGNYVKDYKPIKGACGTLGYISPEIFNTLLYTFQSEIFSLGVCLAVIDNFETLEPSLKQKNLDCLHGFKIPFEPSYLVKNELIKRNTKIYDIILKTVAFNQEKRKNLSSIIADLHQKYGYQFYSKEFTFFQNIASDFQYRKIAHFALSNNIGPDGAKAVASEIAKCPTLSTLTLALQSNNIGPDGAKAVASEIAKCPTLSTLSLALQSNNIGPDGAKAVASEIAKCPTLSTLSLDLQSNNIGPDGAKAVASEIAKCPTLSTLSLGLQSNNIGPDGAKAVASEIAKCPTLSTLSLALQSNKIGPDGAKAVASEIAKCPTISTLSLYLYNNNIGPDGAKAVASEIAKCPTLSTLSLALQSNKIGPDGAKAVASEIAKCPTISTLSLYLQSNNIGPDGAKAVASEIAKCPSLSTLTLALDYNQLNGDELLENMFRKNMILNIQY